MWLYGSPFFEESLAVMKSVEDQHELTPKSALVCHPKDPLSSWLELPSYPSGMETLSSLLVL